MGWDLRRYGYQIPTLRHDTLRLRSAMRFSGPDLGWHNCSQTTALREEYSRPLGALYRRESGDLLEMKQLEDSRDIFVPTRRTKRRRTSNEQVCFEHTSHCRFVHV